jgi:tRNA 2-thiouridine synthesizing protein A
MSELSAHHSLDAVGLYCPEPVMLLHSVVRKAQAGEIIRLTTTDPASLRDVPKFCLFLGHELIKTTNEQEQYEFWIRKSP